MTVEVPSDGSRTRRIALVVLLALVGAVLVGIAVWAAFFRADDGRTGQRGYRRAQSTVESTVTADSRDTSATPGSSSPGTGAAQPPAQAPQATAPERIAFVLGGRIYVAAEDGSGAVAVAPAGGVYSVSPDGATVALVADASGSAGELGTLSLVDTTSGMMSSLAQDTVFAAPVWAPDSKRLFAVSTTADGEPRLMRHDRSGKTSKVIAKDVSAVRVAIEGDRIAYGGLLGEEAIPIRVVPIDGGSARKVAGSTGATSWGWGPGSVLYFAKESSTPATWELWRAAGPEYKGEAIATLALEAPAYAVGDVIVSHTGDHVLLSAVGDDAYSRLWIADLEAHRFDAISTRQDAYPLGWDSTGRVLYFEGNTFQGEPSALVSVLPSGRSRRTVVTGAQR